MQQKRGLSGRVHPKATRGALLGATFASVLAVSPALAAEGPQGVRPGHNVTVFHNIDMVAAFGSAAGEQIQVDVFRDGHRIATARGAAVDTPEGGALEVNHGPEGPVLPGDCWVGATPDIRPGDRVVVSNPGGSQGIDEAIVDNLAITGRRSVTRDADTGGEVVVITPAVPAVPPVPAVPEVPATDTTEAIPGTPEIPGTPAIPEVTEPTRQEVWIEGVAEYVNEDGVATPIPVERLDSFEFLGVPDDNQLRLAPNEVVAGPTPGTFIAKYYDENPANPRSGFNVDRNRENRSDAYIFNAVATGEGHAMGFGHVDPLPAVSMLVDGLEEQDTAAPGCEAAPKLPSSLGTASAEVLNIANAGSGATDPVLTLGGWAAPDVTSAKVVLTSAGESVEKDVDLTGSNAGQQGWGASFAAAELADLPEGDVHAQLSIDGVRVGAVKTIRYDLTAPEISVDLLEGTYTGTQRLVPSGADADVITYALDGGPERPYAGGAIELGVGEHVLVLRCTDAAGNLTERSFAFTIKPVPAARPAAEPVEDVAPAAAEATQQEQPAVLQQQPLAPALVGPPTSAAPPTVTMLRGRVRLDLATARRTGILAEFTAPEGARRAVIRVSRLRAGRLTLSGSRTAAVRAGANRIRLSSKALRRKLTTGRYVVEVSLRGIDGASGNPAVSSLRIVP